MRLRPWRRAGSGRVAGRRAGAARLQRGRRISGDTSHVIGFSRSTARSKVGRVPNLAPAVEHRSGGPSLSFACPSSIIHRNSLKKYGAYAQNRTEYLRFCPVQQSRGMSEIHRPKRGGRRVRRLDDLLVCISF